MSKKHAEEKKSKKKSSDCLKNILSSSRFLTRATRNFFVTKTTKIWSQTHKKPIKNAHRSAQNSNIFSGEAPQTPLPRGGITPSRALPPLVPSALDGFLRRITFKYAATALLVKNNFYILASCGGGGGGGGQKLFNSARSSSEILPIPMQYK